MPLISRAPPKHGFPAGREPNARANADCFCADPAQTPGAMHHCLPRLPLAAAVCLLAGGCSAPTSDSRGASRDVARVDLVSRPWFPPIVRQEHHSCAQHVALHYLLGSELNRSRGRSADDPAARLATAFAYSVLADDRSGRSHVVDGWLLAEACGVPLATDLPAGGSAVPDGFDRWRRALAHRPADWRLLPLHDDATLRPVLDELAAGHPLACEFPVRGAAVRAFREPNAAACAAMVASWGSSGPGHAMVLAGYDESIGRDCNGDGLVTNDRDITGDGRVTLADRERGAFLLVNPWGRSWGDRGRAWMLFREHALTRWPWAKSVATVRAAPPEPPTVMLLLRLRCRDRSALTIAAAPRHDPAPAAWQPLLFRDTPADRPPGRNVWEALARLNRPGPHISRGPLASLSGGPVEIGLQLPDTWHSGTFSLALRPAPGRSLDGELVDAAIVFLAPDGSRRRTLTFSGLPASLPPAGGVWHTAGSSTR